MLSGRYEIIELVGSGGMSEVYKAKCHVLNRFVAIKVLKPDYSSDMNFVAKFRIEAQSAAGLSHPNIVNVYDVGEDRGIYFIVMELVEGITLKEYIQNHGRIPAMQAIDFAIQIAQGLQAAHEHHTIHRDIKPQNIIISNNGTLKVTDFGIARAASSSTTTTNNTMGSIHYISPEQARGGFSDERSDIYSMGITMYEMITGHVPFEGENNVAIALMHIQGEMISPREYYPDIPTSLEKIIRKCTQKKPERRYLTANALIADLNRVKENPNIDCIVVPKQSVPSSPTIEMTDQEMEMIKTGRQVEQMESAAGSAKISSEVEAGMHVNRPVIQKSEFDDLFPDDEGDDEYDDDGYSDDYRRVSDDRNSAQYGDDELDPRLKKIIMVASIAIAVVLAILAILLIGKIAGWNLFSNSGQEPSTESNVITTEGSEEVTEQETVPMVNVIGLYRTAAEEQMKKNGFTNYEFVEQTDATVEKGYVISQSIDEGVSITKDSYISIVVSSGREMTTVPDVVGYEDSQATTLIEEAKLVVTHGYEYSDDVEKDHVISSDPVAGTELEEGSTVKIIISNGKEEKPVVVPNLAGMTEEEATAALTESNLAGSPSYEYSDEVEKGKVISQDPAVNTEVDEGSLVTYVVSNGPEVKTYAASFSGSVSNIEFDFETFGEVTVNISYNVGEESYTLYSGSLDEVGFPVSIDGVDQLTGLDTNSGSFSVVITDVDGIDVTSSFDTSSLSATFVQEN